MKLRFVYCMSSHSTLVSVQMMQQLARRLRDLHAMGFVHRDLKPGNVMWLPREDRWTVIDFGCVARTGEDAKLGFSIAYAAPEVVAAYRSGQRSMVAQVCSPGHRL
jgi:serine/threonine protein kinase